MCQNEINNNYPKYRNEIVKYLTANFMNCGKEDALDIYHDALYAILILCKDKEGFKLTEDFLPLVKTICKRKIIDQIRRERTINKIKEDISHTTDKTIEAIAKEAILAQCQHELYLKCFDELSIDCQKILDVRFQGYSWEEVVRILTIEGKSPENNARNRAFYCRKKLFDSIDNDSRCDEYKY